MKHLSKVFALVLALLMVATMVPAMADSVAGTYSVTYGTQDISGNIRHTGYLTNMGCQEKNTLILNEDGTYVYSKMVTAEEGLLNGTMEIPEVEIEEEAPAAEESAPAADEAASAAVLFSWAPNNEGDDKGSCTLDFYADGTFSFVFPSFNLTEKGTWSWSGWKMSVTRSDGEVFTPAMDDAHALYFDYVSAASASLHQNFIVGSDVWGAKLGGDGTYVPSAAAAAPVQTEVAASEEAPAEVAPIVLYYEFTGTYTADGDEVTLDVPTACTWTESWGRLANYGFHNGTGNEADAVYPKGTTDKYFWAIDHFDGQYLIAYSHLATEVDAPKADLTPITLELDSYDMSFEYIFESVFD